MLSSQRQNYVLIPLFFFLYLILPSYFAIEFSASLPLLTASRILILILLFYCMAQSGAWKLRVYKLNGVGICFAVLVVIDILHLIDSGSAVIKDIFSIGLEQLLLIMLIVSVLDTKDKILCAVKWLVYASFFIGILGIIEAFTGVNVFYFFKTTSREMLQSSYIRLGLTRSSGPFGHAVYYGAYCTLMFPLSLYMYESRRQFRYVVIAAMNITACLFSESRGQILVMCVLVFFLFLRKNPLKNRRHIKYMVAAVFVVAALCLAVPSLFETVLNIGKSVLNALGAQFQIENFGTNESGVNSRLWQLSAALYLVKQGAALIGFGPDAFARGLVKYYWPPYDTWSVSTTCDVGYIGYLMQYGIVGFIASIGIILIPLRIAWKGRNKQDGTNFNNTMVWYFAAVFLNLTCVSVSGDLIAIGIGLMFANQRVLGLHENMVIKKG